MGTNWATPTSMEEHVDHSFVATYPRMSWVEPLELASGNHILSKTLYMIFISIIKKLYLFSSLHTYSMTKSSSLFLSGVEGGKQRKTKRTGSSEEQITKK